MNYIGSKLSLLGFLDESIKKVVGNNNMNFADLFAGTGAVGAHFKKLGYKITSNDIQYYSFVLNKHYIENHKELKFEKLFQVLPELKKIKIEDRKNYVCSYLSSLKGVQGFIYKNYCLGGTKNKKYPRQYFSDENGMKCDAVRIEIEKWKNDKQKTDTKSRKRREQDPNSASVGRSIWMRRHRKRKRIHARKHQRHTPCRRRYRLSEHTNAYQPPRKQCIGQRNQSKL
jgi:adenine-specific DNA methylase